MSPAVLAQKPQGRAADLQTRARTTSNVNYDLGEPVRIELRQERPGGWPLPFGVQFGPGLSGGDPGSGPAGYGADSISVEIVVPVN